MQKTILFTIAFCLSISLAAEAQSLDRLRTRADQYLAARAAGNRLDLARFAPVDKRNAFADRNPPPLAKAKMEGFEFTTDPKTVYVLYSATFTMENVGPVSTKVREAWAWDGKEWFLQLKDTGNPFEILKSTPSPAVEVKAVPFELSTPELNLGKHVQGELISRTITFKSDQASFKTFRTNDLKGLVVTGMSWTSKDMGQLEVMLDTTLVNGSINYPVELEILGWQGQKTPAKFKVTAEIEPRLRFSQSPEIIDPTKAGTAIVQIENLSNTAFRPNLLESTNEIYQITNYTPQVVAPGETLKITVSYSAQKNPVGASLRVETTPVALAKSDFTLPLDVKLPETRGVGYTREELEEIMKHNK